jgi:hypothetical protein
MRGSASTRRTPRQLIIYSNILYADDISIPAIAIAAPASKSEPNSDLLSEFSNACRWEFDSLRAQQF